MSVLCFFEIAGKRQGYIAGLVHVPHFRGVSALAFGLNAGLNKLTITAILVRLPGLLTFVAEY